VSIFFRFFMLFIVLLLGVFGCELLGGVGAADAANTGFGSPVMPWYMILAAEKNVLRPRRPFSTSTYVSTHKFSEQHPCGKLPYGPTVYSNFGSIGLLISIFFFGLFLIYQATRKASAEKDCWVAAEVHASLNVDTVSVLINPDLSSGHRVTCGYHAENQGRVEAITAKLKEEAATLGVRMCVTSPVIDELALAAARNAAILAHSEFYVNAIADISRQLTGTGNSVFLDADTYATEFTHATTLSTMASWLAAAEHALQTRKPAMAVCRPPGHHALRESPMGFCILNYGAAIALYMAAKHPAVKRVAVLDWDVHQGNGLVDILANAPHVRYVSLHQVPCYPFQGDSLGEVGTHRNCRNVPVPPGTTWESGYRDLFVTHALPFLYDGEWGRPDLVIVCAGYDACTADELAGVCLDPADFGEMARLLRQHLGPDIPISLGLEGGYDYDATSAAVVQTIIGLSEQPQG